MLTKRCRFHNQILCMNYFWQALKVKIDNMYLSILGSINIPSPHIYNNDRYIYMNALRKLKRIIREDIFVSLIQYVQFQCGVLIFS